MNKLHIVLIEKSSHWHVSVWKKNFFLPFLLAEKKYAKTNPEELTAAIADDLKNSCPHLIKNSVWHICLDPKNVIVKEWKFPFSSPAKIKKAIGIMLDVEMPQANLFTHTAVIGKKEKNDTETTAYTLSCLTSFLTSWYSLTDRYGAAQTKITFLPFPYLLGQNHAEEKNYLALYDETFFSICCKKNHIKKLYYIQLLKNEQNGKYFNAAMNFILPHAEHSEFIIISENKQELKEYLDKEINYAPYIAIPKLQSFSDLLKKCAFLKKKSPFKHAVYSTENIVAHNILLSFGVDSLFFTHKNKTNSPEKTSRSTQLEKLLNPNFIPYYLIVFCLVLGLSSLSIKLTALKNENKSYLTEIQSSYKKAVPGAPYFSSFKQLKSVLLNRIAPESAAHSQNSPLAVLERLSERLPDKEKIILTSFNMNKNIVSINASTTNYEELDNITNTLKADSDISNVKVTSASIIKGQNKFNINFEITFNVEDTI